MFDGRMESQDKNENDLNERFSVLSKVEKCIQLNICMRLMSQSNHANIGPLLTEWTK